MKFMLPKVLSPFSKNHICKQKKRFFSRVKLNMRFGPKSALEKCSFCKSFYESKNFSLLAIQSTYP